MKIHFLTALHGQRNLWELRILKNHTKHLIAIPVSPITKHLLFIYNKIWTRYNGWWHTYASMLTLHGVSTRRPFWSRVLGKEARQFVTCDFNRGMLGWALLHRWHRNSMDNMLSSSFRIAFPLLLTSSITSTESRKKAVLKEFQCFLFFKCVESKSWLITCRCSCRIDGSCKRKHPKVLIRQSRFSAP